MTLPTADEYIQAGLSGFRASLKQRTVFGPTGRFTTHSNGERLIYGPSGTVIGRVVEDDLATTQIEQDDKLHVVIRPRQQRFLVSRSTGEVITLG